MRLCRPNHRLQLTARPSAASPAPAGPQLNLALASMGTEIAVPFFGPLIAVGVAVLLYMTILDRRRVDISSQTLGLGRRRIALGYLGALLALVVYCYLDTSDLSRMKITRGDVTEAEAARYFWGWYLNIFCLMTPFMIFFLTALGLPVLAALRRIRFASVVGAVLSSQLITLFLTLWVVAFPYNQWCASNALKCMASKFASSAVISGALAIGFSLSARLPLWRSGAMPANPPLNTDAPKDRAPLS